MSGYGTETTTTVGELIRILSITSGAAGSFGPFYWHPPWEVCGILLGSFCHGGDTLQMFKHAACDKPGTRATAQRPVRLQQNRLRENRIQNRREHHVARWFNTNGYGSK